MKIDLKKRIAEIDSIKDPMSRAEEIINSTEDSRLEGQLKTAWGHHYLQSEDLSAAREAFEQALEMTSEETERAAILNPLGLTLRSMGKADLALNTFLASSDSNQKTGNLAAEYQAFQNIAELHREMGQPEEAAAAEQRLADLSQTLKEAGHPVEDDIIRYADFNLTTRFVPDIPTAEDSLNFAPLVKALGDMLSDSKTSLPLAIALTAPWGGGKSSLMKQLQKYLMDDSQNAEDRQWQTVWFDAWKYETNEQVWASLANHFGENFLGKIVQATIQIPPPGNTALARLLSSITGNNPPQALAAAQQPFDQQQVEKAVQAFKQAELKNPVDAEKQRDKVEKSLPDIRPEDVDEALRQVRGDLLTSDSKDVATAEFAVLKYLPPNPRTLKRFDNLFRLQLHVTNNTPGCRINFKYEEIEAMARWVALRFRWPDLAKLIDKDPSLLENLDQSVNDDQTPSDEIKKWIDDDYLRGLLSTGQKGTRVSALPFDTFLRVT